MLQGPRSVMPSAVKGRVRKGTLKAANAVPRMSMDEKRLAREMHFDRGFSRTQVAEALGRDLGTICRQLGKGKAAKPIGRPKLLTETKVDSLVATLDKMVDEAESCYEVSLPMLMKRTRVKASYRVVANALHARGYWFRSLRAKPILTPDDVAERFAFAKKYKGKTASWWLRSIHIHLDNHNFKVATTARGRKLLAMRNTRGVYRTAQKALRKGHVKPSPKLKQSTGVRGILKAGGVGNGKVLVWHTVDKQWSGAEAENLYKNVVAPALKREYPKAKSFYALEDNDRTGNTSNKGKAAKKDCKLKVFQIPKHSPDLNVMDYSVWAEVERRMRCQEKKWKKNKWETRAQFQARLDRTAKGLPSSYINKAISDMARRCDLLFKAKGGLFEEGGRPKKAM